MAKKIKCNCFVVHAHEDWQKKNALEMLRSGNEAYATIGAMMLDVTQCKAWQDAQKKEKN